MGRIRSIVRTRDRLIDAERLRVEREETAARAVAERKSALNRIAGEFEKSVGGIVAGAASAATVTVSDADPSSSVRPLSATFSLAETVIPVRSIALKPVRSIFNV